MRKYVQYRLPKFYYLHKYFKQREFTLLDIGAGNHSASKTKTLFPNCEYHGVDIEDFNNSEEDYKAMTAFYQMDLTQLDFDVIPANYFDFIRMSHVIEHLKNGDQVILGLLPKLKKGGYIYLEYPGLRSTKLPSMHETLNFYDDPTHVRLYSLAEINDLLSTSGLHVLRSGTRRNWFYISAMPLRILEHVLKREKLKGNIFWDLLGFAEFVLAKK